MGTSAGVAGGKAAQINVTPMIDILLVLLIVFMVIVPAAPGGLSALLPQPPQRGIEASPEKAVVIRVVGRPGAALSYRIDDALVAHDAILAKLEEIFARRADRVLFVEGDGQVRFADVADLIDIGRAAHVDRVGLVTPGSRPVE